MIFANLNSQNLCYIPQATYYKISLLTLSLPSITDLQKKKKV